MAQEVKNLYLSKINLGGKDYFLKDTELRDTVANLQKAGLEIVIKDQSWVNDPLNAEKSRGKLILVKDAGSETGTYVEYVAVNTESGYVFERIGTTAADLTDYVMKTTTVAGLALDANISVEALQGALKLKALAYKDEATGEVPTQTISGVKATGSLKGTATVEHTPAKATAETKAITPEISIKSDASATVNDKTVNAEEAPEGAFELKGTVSAPSITITPNTKDASELFTAGELPKFKADPLTKASLSKTTNQFAIAGLVAEVSGTEEDGVLTFSDAGKADAVNGITFDGGSFDMEQFDAGSKSSITGTVVQGIQKPVVGTPIFTGKKYNLALNSNVIDVVQAAYQSNALNVVDETKISYDKANAEAAVTANKGELAVEDIVVKAKNVTVK